MVSVRKSHLMSTTSFDKWISRLPLNNDKKSALESVWQQINSYFTDNVECQTKSLEMVEILAELNLDAESLCAAFIVPLHQYNLISLDKIHKMFGEPIYLLCKGVAQMEAIKTLQQSETNHLGNNQIDNIRRMLLAMVDDVRAVVIKLAERLCYLRIVKNSDEETRVLTAQETKNIYAPLANRLGIGQLKWELEDLSFRYLHPETYMKIASWLDGKRLEREAYMVNFVDTLQQQLINMSIDGKVYGRPKHIFSIWKKMQNKSLDFKQLFDVRAVRIIVPKLQDCYSALGAVHTTWKHLPSEFDDYVATPKPNGYQSIHTVVLGNEGKPVEVQIRTQQMDEDAELGVAAHWKYKEGNANAKQSGFDEKINWLRKILQWHDDMNDKRSMLDEFRSQVFEDRIYVFTPNGDVIDLPMGSTPLDFAYYIHSNVGNSCVGAKVAGRIVPFTYRLQTGDQVEILTSKKATPSRDWLNPNFNYVHTSRARSKVQHFFKQLDRDKHLLHGKEQLEHEMQKQHIDEHVELGDISAHFNLSTVDDLYIGIGSGHLKLIQVIHLIKEQIQGEQNNDEVDIERLVKKNHDTGRVDINGITVSGVGNLLTHMAKCCQPVSGDRILGFITQGRGISVHRKDCEQLASALLKQPERQIDVQWGVSEKQQYKVTLKIFANDRQGLLRDVSTIVTNERVSILGIESNSDVVKQSMSMLLKLEIDDTKALTRLMNKINLIDDVVDVYRL